MTQDEFEQAVMLRDDLRRDADKRAIERWRAEKSGRELTLPEHADLCVWLLKERDELIETLRDVEALLTIVQPRSNTEDYLETLGKVRASLHLAQFGMVAQ